MTPMYQEFDGSLTNINEINIEPELAIIREMNYWNERQLTPVGDITVIKSLSLQKLTQH